MTSKTTLIVPAVAIGNVGQLACETICSHLVPAGTPSEILDNKGYLQACVGAKPGSDLATSLELVALSPFVSVLQIRSPVVPGKSRLLAKYILDLAKTHGFSHLVVVGGASALALTTAGDFNDTRTIPR
jgi:hypothetical protein